MADMRTNRLLALVFILSAACSLTAQQVYTTQDYKNAERWMGYNLTGLVQHTVSGVTYLPDGRISYKDGKEAKIADPVKLTIADAPKPEAPKTPAAKPAAPARKKAGAENLSPDKKLAAFIRDNNLWVKTVATGEERSSPSTAFPTSAMRPTTPAGNIQTQPYSPGRQTRRRSPPSSSTSARPA